jgi:hypothetical protein
LIKHFIIILLSLFVFATSSIFSIVAIFLFNWANVLARDIAVVIFWISGFAISSRLLWFFAEGLKE